MATQPSNIQVESSNILVKNLVKKFGNTIALEDINFEIKEGEFFALLGPSGCGKTTTMRCIAGFEDPTSGTIEIGKEVVNNKPANKRECSMVFQSYALFPHYNVFENVAFGLNIQEMNQAKMSTKLKALARLISKKLSKTPDEIKEKVYDALNYVELGEYADRRVSELSGGQQQRVALARALVTSPKVLLLDEPLSNLDKKLRNTMRDTIRKIQLDLGITTIFVTHDQEEAMSMADRIAVMKDGHIQQIDSPTNLYSKPKNAFIADFVGSSNILEGINSKKDENYSEIKTGDLNVLAETDNTHENVELVIRPENIEISSEGFDEGQTNVFEGTVEIATYLGSIVRYTILVKETELLVDTTYNSGSKVLSEGSYVKLKIDPKRVVVL